MCISQLITIIESERVQISSFKLFFFSNHMVSIHNQYENSESGIIIPGFPDDTNETIQKK